MTLRLSADSPGDGAGVPLIRVLIVEANAVNRSCTAAALEGVVDGTILTTHAVGGYTGDCPPHAVIFSSADPHAIALETSLNAAARRWPGAALITLVDMNDVEPLIRVLAAGASVVLPTSADGEAIALAIRLARHGTAVIPRELLASLTRGGGGSACAVGTDDASSGVLGKRGAVLTQRQRQVLQLLAYGLSNKAIAARLAISESTVKVHIRAIMAQSGVTNRTQIVAQLLAGNDDSPKGW
ncbi:response regulator transcription factor [Novosphingobium sp. RD2P27]|uniref:Response regulator transcription factor n=1 Tax=Novosphingobium kalidii TaxID=3230299 RepID=A0ABV2D4A9_9SPHN